MLIFIPIAHADPIVTIPSNFIASTSAVTSQLFTDLSTPIILIIGILLAAIVIDIIIGAIRGH